MEIIIGNFGKQEVEFYEIEGMKELFLCTFQYENKEYSGLMDENFRILIPFSDVPIQDYIFTMDRNHYCFSRYSEGINNYKSYHLSKNKEDYLFYLKNEFQSADDVSIRITDAVPPKKNYWFVEITIDGITEISLYDIQKGKIITPAFSLISFEKEKSRVLAYIEKDVYATIDGEKIMLASLSGFIDKEGHFLTPLYNPADDEYYDTLGYYFDDTFQSFECAMESISEKLKQRFLEKKAHVEDVLDEMYANIYTEEEINTSKCNAKIIKFPSEVK